MQNSMKSMLCVRKGGNHKDMYYLYSKNKKINIKLIKWLPLELPYFCLTRTALYTNRSGGHYFLKRHLNGTHF